MTHRVTRLAALLCAAAAGACDQSRTAADVERWRLEIVQRVEPAADPRSPNAPGRFVGVVRSDDGGLVVADRAAGALHFYDPVGAPVKSVAGAGDAGSFRDLIGLQRIRGDSLAVFDALRLVHVLAADGAYGRTLLLFEQDTATHTVFRLHGFFRDGATLAVGWPQPQGGALLDSLRLRVYSPAGALDHVLGPFPAVRYAGRERVVFSPITSVAIVDDRIVVGYPDSFRVRVFARDGTDVAQLARPWTARAVTDAERGWYANAFLNAADDDGAPPSAELRELRRRALQAVSFAPHLPAYRRILAGVDDRIWVEHYHPEHELPATLSPVPRGPGFWSVFDLEDGWIADVEVPAGVRILDVVADHATGVQRDAAGAERPVLLRIARDGAPSTDPAP